MWRFAMAAMTAATFAIPMAVQAQPAAQPAAAPAAAATPAPASRRNPADPATWTIGRAKDYKAPEGVTFRTVSFQSEGVRLHGELYRPTSAPKDAKLPTIVLAHGWGGTASGFRTDAVQMVKAGFQVFAFDYRGWGESDGRLILKGTYPDPMPAGRTFTAQVEAIRGYVDPWEQAEDWFNALNFIAGEPGVDADRIGIRGSSYSGGLVLYVAAHDDRVKALVSQVGGIGSRPDPANRPQPGSQYYERWKNRHANGIAMSRGERGYPEPGAMMGGLVGQPVGDKMSRWWPAEDAYNVTAPALFVLAADEELVNNKTNGERAYERVKGPKKLVTIPGIKHYGIYNEAREQAVDLAIAWFKEHLK
jgi:dipeptidyl aminopeptidase/acylaminoacyl peptidase